MPIHASAFLVMWRQVSRLKKKSQGFALPTVLIVSTIMLMVLMSAIQSSVSVTESMESQYTAKLGKSAADAGIAMAKYCYITNSNVTWSYSSPLKPNSNCSGVDSPTCSNVSTDPVCYVMLSPGYRTRFIVSAFDTGSTPAAQVISSQGLVEELRKTTGEPVNRTTFTVKTTVVPPPGVFSTY